MAFGLTIFMRPWVSNARFSRFSPGSALEQPISLVLKTVCESAPQKCIRPLLID